MVNATNGSSRKRRKPKDEWFKSPEHGKWHRRVEGQIYDHMHQHPEFYTGVKERTTFARSLAKRIVGEIIADGANHVSNKPWYCVCVNDIKAFIGRCVPPMRRSN
jgi:hypothetical protein